MDASGPQRGLTYALLHASGGSDRPNAWDRVTLSYAGWTTDGQMLEGSSRATFEVEKVMPGWREALQLLAAGDRARVDSRKPHRASVAPWHARVRHRAALDRATPRATASARARSSTAPRRRADPERPRVSLPRQGPERRATQGELAIRLHYSGWTTDGTPFDSCVALHKPRTVSLRSVMAGWRKGLRLMALGDKALFGIPEQLAYRGAAGAPRGTLVYEIELLGILGALERLREMGVCRIDLKPENIMLTHGGSRPVLIDFGIAKAGLDHFDSTMIPPLPEWAASWGRRSTCRQSKSRIVECRHSQ